MKRDWFVDTFGHPIADVRAKLIDEAWFDRRTQEPKHGSDLGWFRDDARADHARFSNAANPDRDHDRHHDRHEDRGIDLDR